MKISQAFQTYFRFRRDRRLLLEFCAQRQIVGQTSPKYNVPAVKDDKYLSDINMKFQCQYDFEN